jgi:hypothetical protein
MEPEGSLPSITKYYSVDQIQKNEMGGACSMYGERRRTYRILVGRPQGRNTLGDTGVDRRIILKWIFKKWDGGMERIELAQDTDRWRGLVIMVK